MSSEAEYTPPNVWQWNKENGGRFANINRPIAGLTHDKDLPVGKHPLQLYSLATPNGVKVTVSGDDLIVEGRGHVPGGGLVATHMDHRIAMSALVMGCAADQPVKIDDTGFIATSFPDFIPMMRTLGADFA